MNKSSYFIEDKALFGSYPTQEDIDYFESIGVKHFTDLTTEFDNLDNYNTKHNYIKFPIIDRKVPLNIKEYSQFILKLFSIINCLKEGEKIYVHCKGGHGRAGVVVATLLVLYHKVTPTDALLLTNEYHSQRIEMKERWRKIGSPQTNSQKKFIHKLFNPLYFTRVSNGFKSGLSNLSNNKVTINGETYDNAELAYQALKLNKLNVEYKTDVKNIYYFRNYAEKKFNIKDEDKLEIMKNIITTKYAQNDDIRNNLLNIGLRPIIYSCNRDKFWGIDKHGDGSNNLGVLLTDIKKELLLS